MAIPPLYHGSHATRPHFLVQNTPRTMVLPIAMMHHNHGLNSCSTVMDQPTRRPNSQPAVTDQVTQLPHVQRAAVCQPPPRPISHIMQPMPRSVNQPTTMTHRLPGSRIVSLDQQQQIPNSQVSKQAQLRPNTPADDHGVQPTVMVKPSEGSSSESTIMVNTPLGSIPLPVAQMRCGICSTQAKFLCSGCKRVAYCSQKCQVIHFRIFCDSDIMRVVISLVVINIF